MSCTPDQLRASDDVVDEVVPTIDRDADFRSFYGRCEPAVRRYVVRRVRGDADDVIESVFITAWEKDVMRPVDHDEELVWLYAIARRKIANLVRLKKRRDRFAITQDVETAADVTTAGDSDVAEIVRSALGRLSASKREILLLVEWDGLSVDQAARILDISPSAAGKRLWAARSAFRTLCEGRLDSSSR